MINGFQLLETYFPDEKVNVESFEEKMGFALPPLYKLFVKTFRLGKKMKGEEFFDPKEQHKFEFNMPVYEPLMNDEKKYFELLNFYSIDEAYEKWNAWGENEICNWTQYKFLDIGSIFPGGNLCVGTSMNEIDIIYQVFWDFPAQPMKIADNIFEFTKGLVIQDATGVYYDYPISNFYKKYGEDFWRVREE